MKPAKRRKFSAGIRRNTSGVYVALLALMIMALMLFVGLVISVSFLSLNAARLQHVANLVSLAGLESFAQTDPETVPYYQRTNQALVRVNEIYSMNSLPGIHGTLGGITHVSDQVEGGGGSIEFGKWYRETPLSGDPCPEYPCFVANDPPHEGQDAQANAVRVRLKNNAPFELPFCRLFGNCEEDLRADAIATLAQTCVAFVVDLSRSTFFTTHKNPVKWLIKGHEDTGDIWETVPYCTGFPGIQADDLYRCNVTQVSESPPQYEATNVGAPFFRNDGNETGSFDCSSSSYGNWDRWYWCSLARQGEDKNFSFDRPDGETDITRHYRSDYVSRTYVDQDGTTHQVLVDSFVSETYEGPEPFTSFFHAINAALRSLKRQSAAEDKAMLTGFSGHLKAKFPSPPPDSPDPRLTRDFGPIIQVSNLNNRGTIDVNLATVHPEAHPNFLDYNFISYLGGGDELESNTNILIALNDAIRVLREECPSSAQRTIILLTDGVSSCRRASGSSDSVDPDDYACDTDDIGFYYDAFGQMWGDIRPVMQSNQISLVTILAGEHVGPNFKNVAHPEDGRPLTPEEAFAYNMDLGDSFDSTNEPDSESDPAQVYSRLGRPGYVFRLPNFLMALLSLNTKGIFCPLMPKCGPGHPAPGGECGEEGNECYEPSNPEDPNSIGILKSTLRTAGVPQTCSLYNLSQAQQAAKCAVDFLSGSRYVLAMEEN